MILKEILDSSHFDFYNRWVEGKDNHESYSPYGTHMPVLIQAFFNTTGRVLELGCGNFSTPQLHLLCKYYRRDLITMDTGANWLNKFRDLESTNHKLLLVEDYDTWNWHVPELDQDWGLVLVDNAPGESRVNHILKLQNINGILLAHDAQEKGYKYQQCFNRFKYQYHYEEDRKSVV